MGIDRDFQLPLFGGQATKQIVNVASAPQRSPFRYPGGKTWLIPLVRQWLLHLPQRPTELIEPFAGGAIIGLTVAFERLANHVTIVELDEQVASVWKAILYGDYEWLAKKIIHFDISPENVDRELAKKEVSDEGKAFQTILRNRVNRGGILAPGAGRMKNGENGKGIKSRWYPETLSKRILNIGKYRESITFIQGNGLQVLEQNAHRSDVVYFIDPPYTAAGKKAGSRLYSCFEMDHEKLFSIAQTLEGDFLMTYDNALGVKQMADRRGFVTDLVAMKNTHHAEMNELLIGRNLNWLAGG